MTPVVGLPEVIKLHFIKKQWHNSKQHVKLNPISTIWLWRSNSTMLESWSPSKSNRAQCWNGIKGKRQWHLQSFFSSVGLAGKHITGSPRENCSGLISVKRWRVDSEFSLESFAPNEESTFARPRYFDLFMLTHQLMMIFIASCYTSLAEEDESASRKNWSTTFCVTFLSIATWALAG